MNEKRDPTYDVMRGLLVVMMVYGHVMQFFADTSLFPLAGKLINGINLAVFPSFVFCFGCTAALAYLQKPYVRALPGMVRTTVRALCAFALSGIAYRVLRENRAFASGTVRRVLLLADIPGWSEFLAAFAVYGLLLIVGFALLRRIAGRPLYALGLAAVCLAMCGIPYAQIAPTQLCLLIGGTNFSYFPAVQYMPYFLAGLVFAQGERRTRLLCIAAVMSAAGGLYALKIGGLPERFPPHWAWICLPALGVCGLYAASALLCRVQHLRPLCAGLGHFGARSLYYLLASNFVLFTLSGRGIVPQLARKGIFPFTWPIQSPQGAAVWTAVLLACCLFAARLAGRGGKGCLPPRNE